MNKLLRDVWLIIATATTITLGWRALECLILGEITPNNVDTIIMILFSMSVYRNVKYLGKKTL